ncbi:hypothetical protein GS399_19835 [Pedobacter sp. HMF7647]|uniref:SlyB protein n=1 Tax=Hufsiella arboris TaxID=2695275 RepID=A0A7K1YF44_9SPHI|nr:hypothetical protein [Hufsiella arboris]MXV53223.1 hypothetical protein [Hufsiella arboris]
MLKNKIKAALCAFTVTTLAFAGCASGQNYDTPADTVKLNKEYSELTSDIKDLNAKLVTAQNKTSGYQSKESSSARDAMSAAQESKETASTATNGNVSDSKKAMRQAKKANNKANEAEDAADDQKENSKDITDLNKKIEKKKERLSNLDKQKAAIMAQVASPTDN